MWTSWKIIGIYGKNTYFICSCCFYTGNKDKVCQQKSKGKIEMNKNMDFGEQPLPEKEKNDDLNLHNTNASHTLEGERKPL